MHRICLCLDALNGKLKKGLVDMLTDNELNELLHDIINIEQRYQDSLINKRKDEVRKKIIDGYLRQKEKEDGEKL